VILSPQVSRHLRAHRLGVAQPVTTIELFFDLVYGFAITQLTQLVLHDLTAGAAARATFLLLVVWWAWICTRWMANWFDPGSPAVGALLTAAMLASLPMAAAIPRASAVELSATVAAVLIGLVLWELAPTAGRTWNGQSQHEGVSP
jgi:low temperature requirement protein LtrA